MDEAYARKLERIAEEIRAFCRRNANPALVKKYAIYFKEGYDAYGVPGELTEKEKKRLREVYGAELGLKGFLDLGDLLFASGKYEEGFFAIGLAAPYRADFKKGHLARFARWFDKGVCNWAHGDVLCGEIVGPLLADGVAPLEALAPWRSARSKWRRRAVPVAMLNLLKAKPRVKPLLAFVEPMMADGERVVHQGLGWFLREAWKLESKPVEAFLAKYKDTAPRLIFQYATEKMTAADKARFRRAK